MDKTAIISAGKELLRLVLVGVTGAVMAWLTGLQEGFDPASIQAIVLALVIKFADRYAYKAKETNIFHF